MRRKWQGYNRREQVEEIKFVANERIIVPEVFLIDETGEMVGKVSTVEAKRRAAEAELDLAIVNPKAEPPVAKIVNLGQLKYEQEKKIHKQKVAQKKIDTKEIRLSVRIGEHDFNVRAAQAEKFLKDGDKIKIDLILKGREKQHPEKAYEIIRKFVDVLRAIESLSVVEEQGLTKQGGRFNIVLMNKK